MKKKGVNRRGWGGVSHERLLREGTSRCAAKSMEGRSRIAPSDGIVRIRFRSGARSNGLSWDKPVRGKPAPMIFLIACLVFMTGCNYTQFDQFTKKFIRQKKKVEKPTQFLEEPVSRSYDQYYREHYLYWKTWNETLVRNIGGNRKRELEALREARRHLASLPKYLEDEYTNQLLGLIEQFDALGRDVKDRRLTKMSAHPLGRRIEQLGRRINSTFSYDEMKEHLRKGPSRIDITPYLDDEPDSTEPIEQGSPADESIPSSKVEREEIELEALPTQTAGSPIVKS